MTNIKKQLVDLFNSSIEQLSGKKCVHDYLSKHSFQPQYVVAIGKAAAKMLEGIPFDQNLKKAILISAPAYVGDESFDPRVSIVLGSHPVPDEKSLNAGRALLDFLSVVPADARLLFLISGGTSAMVEVLEDGVDLSRLQQINRWMLSQEMDISNINRIRKRLSKIKGGGLLNYFLSHDCRALYISDVISDDPAVIGSGLLVETSETGTSTGELPGWLRDFLQILPERGSAGRIEIKHEIISSAGIAKKVVAQMNALDVPVFVHDEYLDTEVGSVSSDLISCLELAPAGIHIWSGEPVVQL
ncbi:MAG: glycerate-2-kinase family protein, partial [Gammaproteobacteria bacterium]|nr:glycerate-2-kinase family protein [Gammaproteobacteria bacterium]